MLINLCYLSRYSYMPYIYIILPVQDWHFFKKRKKKFTELDIVTSSLSLVSFPNTYAYSVTWVRCFTCKIEELVHCYLTSVFSCWIYKSEQFNIQVKWVSTILWLKIAQWWCSIVCYQVKQSGDSVQTSWLYSDLYNTIQWLYYQF